jgi:DNA-binding NarL/FixJ family response regulator
MRIEFKSLVHVELASKENEMNIKIILADDHKAVRSNLRAMLEKHHGLEVIGEAADGQKIVELARELSADVILMDVTMPGLSGIEATRQIINEFPEVKVIALSMHSDKESVRQMLEAGAKGYQIKGCSINELVSAIHTVVANQTYLSAGISP